MNNYNFLEVTGEIRSNTMNGKDGGTELIGLKGHWTLAETDTVLLFVMDGALTVTGFMTPNEIFEWELNCISLN
jgi:hypothetical protein